jgi:hypothetical protein
VRLREGIEGEFARYRAVVPAGRRRLLFRVALKKHVCYLSVTDGE